MTRIVARVLLFQTVRVLVNSIRRAFANPLRAVLTLLILAFFLCGWGGALIGSLFDNPAPNVQPQMLQPQRLLLRSSGLVVLVHWFYVVFTVFPSLLRPAFALVQESDVHYLFATPLKPLTLFRGMILIRGLFGALFFLVMLTFYLLFFGGARLRVLAMVQEPVAPAIALLIYPILYLLVFGTALLWSVALEAMEIAGRGVR
ncbi:MAG: putative ABC exporter domain-containing protein, partial [Fimbriimonadales bacterium]